MNNQFFLYLAFIAPWPWRKNYLLQNYSRFLQFRSEYLAHLAQLWYIHFIRYYSWSHFRHNFGFPPFQIFLFVFVYMTFLYSRFFPFLFWNWRKSFFFVIFQGSVCWGFMWVMLVVTSSERAIIIVFLLSLLIVLVSTFPIIFRVSATLRFLFFSQTSCSTAET